ncbi:hypothetical protein [Pseudomonas phage D6]|nr:hypothetical protein [Pseudomonas phage D6]
MFALMPDGRTIEAHYQCDVKGIAPGSTDWRLGKGKPPVDRSKDLWKEYKQLWTVWADLNPDLMRELSEACALMDYTLSDKFANTDISQARALCELLNERTY